MPFEGDLMAHVDNSPILEAFENKEIPPCCPGCSEMYPHYPFVLPGNVVGCWSCKWSMALDELKTNVREG